MQQAIETRQMMEAAGIAVDCLSGCSSATYDSTGAMPGVDEVQAGTYATMDRQYHRLVPEFQIALSVLVSVISRPDAGRAVLDLGVKGAGGEFGVPCDPRFSRRGDPVLSLRGAYCRPQRTGLGDWSDVAPDSEPCLHHVQSLP